MTDRTGIITAFLTETSWANATRTPLAGDASARRYERLKSSDGTTAVLMDAPPNTGEDTRPFIQISRYLSAHGFSAPKIYAENPVAGLVLLEDLGDDLFARVISASPRSETRLYQAACDVLLKLHQIPPPTLTVFDPTLMAEQAGLVFTSYQQGITGQPMPDTLAAFKSVLTDLLSKHSDTKHVMILRDYHAENLLWLPDRDGIARVGLLDFQDAVIGHPAYDLASLLQDIRRTVSPETESATIRHYLEQSGADEETFKAAYTLLGVQRNLRILGVFARLATDYGKPHYVDLIPGVWTHVMRGLQHPNLTQLAEILIPTLPKPSPENLQTLRQP
ncbi:MAG: phosphotransferase [Rhodobacteraceae bacterium]|nr:phosphotransferase [Paracoccaceae bacterium]